jgi:hypothetical protein
MSYTDWKSKPDSDGFWWTWCNYTTPPFITMAYISSDERLSWPVQLVGHQGGFPKESSFLGPWLKADVPSNVPEMKEVGWVEEVPK